MGNKIPLFLLQKHAPGVPVRKKSSRGSSFIDKGLRYIAWVIKAGYVEWEPALTRGLLQKVDSRVKVFFLLFFICLISFKQTINAEAGIAAVLFALAVLSRLNIANFYKRVFFFGFVFGFLVALPASLNIITRGEIMALLIELPKPYDFWGYHIPQQIGITRQGIAGVTMLTLRVSNSVALSLLVIATTPFHEVVKSFKVLRVPGVFLMILTLTYKYIFIFTRTVEEMYLSKKSRMAGRTSGAEGRAWVAGRMAFIFRKTQLRCEEVFKAMLARGFSADIRFYGHRLFGAGDRLFAVFMLCAGIVIISM
ncbi:MAG: energy-coupling factor transporter transmembrane component T [Dissulfurispiraceae bacterium]|jgi:cobalt ECF transporter T component CbiQ